MAEKHELTDEDVQFRHTAVGVRIEYDGGDLAHRKAGARVIAALNERLTTDTELREALNTAADDDEQPT